MVSSDGGTVKSSIWGPPKTEGLSISVCVACLAHMLQRTHVLADDFFVVTRRRRRLREWAWEIQRRSKPLGVRLNGDGFKSEFAAKLAGEKALKVFLGGLAQEENV